jgi:hypothetical protein
MLEMDSQSSPLARGVDAGLRVISKLISNTEGNRQLGPAPFLERVQCGGRGTAVLQLTVLNRTFLNRTNQSEGLLW